MKAIINGKTYNTDTATEICDLPCPNVSRSDFRWHDTTLYQTAKGAFFVAGRGGPMSMWATPIGTNGTSGGDGVRVVTADDARGYMEAAKCSPEEFEAVGLSIEEG